MWWNVIVNSYDENGCEQVLPCHRNEQQKDTISMVTGSTGSLKLIVCVNSSVISHKPFSFVDF